MQRRVTFETFVHQNRPYGIERRGRRKNLDEVAPKKSCFRSPWWKKAGSVGQLKSCFEPSHFGHGQLLSTHQMLSNSVAHPFQIILAACVSAADA